jgi:hypothetical protein
MVPTTVLPVKRLVLSAPRALVCAAPAPRGGPRDSKEIYIDHLDGTGTKTIFQVQPSIPGVADFIRATPAPIPKPGEIIVPPTETPARSPSPVRTPRAF